MRNIFIILIIGTLWGIADVLRKFASKGASSELLSTIFNLGTIIAPLIFLIFSLLEKQKIKGEPKSLIVALLGGLLAGIGGYLVFFLLSRGVNISDTIPAIRALSITIVAIGGVMLFSEQMTIQVIMGLIFSVLGIYLLLT